MTGVNMAMNLLKKASRLRFTRLFAQRIPTYVSQIDSLQRSAIHPFFKDSRDPGLHKKNQLHGFTMVELLLVVAIFSVAMLSIAAIYVNFMRLERRASNAEQVGEELRYMGELIVRAARNNRISYAGAPLGYQTSSLTLVNSSNQNIVIEKLASGATECSGLNVTQGCLALTIPGQPRTALSGKNIDIVQFAVYVNPSTDPYTPIGLGVYSSNKQPLVTVFIQARFNTTNPRERVTINFQTSVDSRVYTR